jgi:hypothetical protein
MAAFRYIVTGEFKGLPCVPPSWRAFGWRASILGTRHLGQGGGRRRSSRPLRSRPVRPSTSSSSLLLLLLLLLLASSASAARGPCSRPLPEAAPRSALSGAQSDA